MKPTKLFGIGKAVKEMQNGERVTRLSWADWRGNPNAQWIALVPAGQWELGSGQPYDSGHFAARLQPWIGMCLPDGSFLPWTPRHDDLLATDWQIAPK